ncbi:MAG: response regulator, partial [Clostridia bacterium]|nr:response regulator [Clostridia bacterium]
MFKVLIVDDVDILRRDLRRLKVWGEASGFTITDEAANGKEALQKLNASAFDMVITDIRMPVMDGMALLRAISKDKLCPCVVLLSDYTEFSYAREGLVHGAFDYLGKPIDGQKLEELLQRVKQFLLERENEKAKLKQLEGMVEVAFYPANDV